MAHVVKQTGDVPPRIHSLIRLAEIAGLELDEAQDDFLRVFGVFQLEGRYPDSQLSALDGGIVRGELSKAREIVEWLKKRL